RPSQFILVPNHSHSCINPVGSKSDRDCHPRDLTGFRSKLIGCRVRRHMGPQRAHQGISRSDSSTVGPPPEETYPRGDTDANPCLWVRQRCDFCLKKAPKEIPMPTGIGEV